MGYKTLITAVLLLFSLQGCACRQQEQIVDLQKLPQDTMFYVDSSIPPQEGLLKTSIQTELAEDYLQKWTAPWKHREEPPELDDFLSYVLTLQEDTLFGEHKRPRDQDWLSRIKKNARLEAYSDLNQPGIVTRNSALRLLPTHKPVYRDFAQAGQGYPFDRLQISAVWAGTPLRILHKSADQAWYLVQTGFALGWIPALDVGRMDKLALEQCREQEGFVAVVQDKVPVEDKQGQYLFTAHMGSLLPLVKAEERGWIVLAPARDAQGRVQIKQVRLTKEQAREFPVQAGAVQIASLASGLLGQNYGWGGLYENRDCSAMLRDLFTPFGIWLPRHSGDQAEVGQVVQLSDLDAEEKQRKIMNEAKPWATLIYLPGHIMLYLGDYEGRPVVMHNMWGLRTRDFWGREGRHLVGQAVITSLQPGRELYWLDRTRGDLLERVKSMNILFPAVDGRQ